MQISVIVGKKSKYMEGEGSEEKKKKEEIMQNNLGL